MGSLCQISWFMLQYTAQQTHNHQVIQTSVAYRSTPAVSTLVPTNSHLLQHKDILINEYILCFL